MDKRIAAVSRHAADSGEDYLNKLDVAEILNQTEPMKGFAMSSPASRHTPLVDKAPCDALVYLKEARQDHRETLTQGNSFL